LGEVEGVVPDGDWLLFQEAYLKNLFDASPCGPSPAQDKEAKEKGLADGAEHADALDQEQGADGLRQTQRPDQLAWDESARNAGAFEISCRGLPSDCRDTYYEAYNEGAESRTRELLAAYEEDE
jgi:hypothetical protein